MSSVTRQFLNFWILDDEYLELSFSWFKPLKASTRTLCISQRFVRSSFRNRIYHNLTYTLDHSVAFDTVDHGVLLDVLRHRFGVTHVALDEFKSYLSYRAQSFSFISETSKPVNLTFSVPQGSEIGSKKFVTYTEDIVDKIDFFYDQPPSTPKI